MKKIAIRKELFLLLLPLTLLLITAIILKNDFTYYIKTWGVMLVSGIAFYPLSSFIFKNFSDKGWVFSKVFGFSIPALIMWLLSDLKILKFNNVSCYIIFVICIIVNYSFLFWKNRKDNHLENVFNVKVLKRIIIIESIFIILFTFWFYFKGTSPKIVNQTEQFMDYGFLNSILSTEHMPPRDIWLSGNSINYYYYGIYVMAFICKMASLRVNEGYNIAIALIASFSFVMPLSIVYQALIYSNKRKHNDSNRFVLLAILFAIFAGLGSCFGGTMHYPIYRHLVTEKEDYFYSDETRYIGMDEGEDNCVTEKPAYSHLISDLHAHYIAIIFSYTTMAILLSYFTLDNKKGIAIINPFILLLGILLGILKMTNYWELPIYFVVISIIIIAKEFICNGTKKDFLRVIIYIVEVFVVQGIITSLFEKNFSMGMSQIGLTHSSSPLYKLIVLWGLPALCYFTFLVIALKTLINSKKDIRDYLNDNLTDFFIILLGACAIGLVLIPELVYVKDIYVDADYRFNTMFKLTYEAFIMIGICTAYELYYIILSKTKLMTIFGGLLLFLNLTTYFYGFDAIYTFYNNEYVGINDSEYYIRKKFPGYVEIISWIQNNIDRDKIILEASYMDSSYTTHSLISVFTGNPTVLGWCVHEWLWRTDATLSYPSVVSNRDLIISEIYEGTDKEVVMKQLEEYDVSYIFIGQMEYEDYDNMNVDFLLSLGKVVYKDEINKIYLVNVETID